MSNATSGFGTLLKIGDGATPTEGFTTVAEVISISGPALALGTIEVTNMSSASNYREFVAGLKDAGEVKLDINFLPTDGTQDASAGLLKDFDDRTLRDFQLVFPDASTTTWSFSAFITAFSPSAKVDDRLTASVTLRVSGAPVLA